MLSAFHNVGGDMKQTRNINKKLLTIMWQCHLQEMMLLRLEEGFLLFNYRVIGFEMPSAELVAATAKLTEAQAELRFFTKFDVLSVWCLRCKIPKKKSWRKILNYLWDMPHLLLLPKLHQKMKQSDLKRCFILPVSKSPVILSSSDFHKFRSRKKF
ncbi:hypothetical protein NC653_031446 [Populus alba x Populus x berolinensis]|uniref:Uncharacterized protein n=1 Tax=Populus alba x Populus x berolinensis TaxID=444605 RepID=A0AAD6Q1D7_9ROSI|nr:hypothetical protein NC653_031446 [Populus alba x Populus x berolinensis]